MNQNCVATALLTACLLVIGCTVQASEPGTLEEVRHLIEQEGYHWRANPTAVSERGWDAVRATLSLRQPSDWQRRPRVDFSERHGKPLMLPDHFDWREHDGTTPVKDQGNCGSCWAFASAGAMEAGARIVDGLIYDLSEQQLLSCNQFGYGCGGGWWDGCFDLFSTSGAVGEECMPYLASDLVPCAISECDVLCRASEMILVENNVESIKAAVFEHGPVVSAMTVYPDFTYYDGGCYERSGNEPVNHGVVIVGWDDLACGDDGAWICKNSWGTEWGDLGWFMIRYGSCRIGEAATLFIPVPGQVVMIDTAPIETTTDGTLPFDIIANVYSKTARAIDPGSVSLHYRVDRGDWVSVLFERSRQAEQWAAAIPAFEPPATIDYYLQARDVDGREGRSPAEAPENYHSFDVARAWESFEENPIGWSVGDSFDDASSGVWEWCIPVGTEAQPSHDHSLYGACCWVTGQHVEGGGTGDNDVDNGRTTLTSPGYDLSKVRTARLKYWRWYSNDRGGWPDEDTWLVQARNDGGGWIDLERTNESASDWVLVEHDLYATLGPELGVVEVRFIASDEGGASCVEAAVDDFAILAEPRIPIGVQTPLSSTIEFNLPYPHPLVEGSTITLTGLDLASAQVEIFSPDGRLVRRLSESSDGPMQRSFYWDGRDASGRPVASGAYFTRLVGVPYRATGMILVAR